jgi:hypothetical protein
MSKHFIGVNLAVALSIFLPLWGIAADGPLIFNVPQANTLNDRYRSVTPERVSLCRALFAISNVTNVSIGRIISFADKQFERRGWSKEFLAERIALAENFPNSEYFYTKNGAEIVGTIAATYAEYGRGSSSSERLPMEDSLSLSNLRRPKDSQNRGLITEMRTYAIDGKFPRDIRSALSFVALRSVLEKYKNYPELADQPVIYTYGDETSIRLYQPMGFVNLSEQWNELPVDHAGTKWWILGITPNKLNALINREADRFGHFAKNERENVLLPNGRTVKIRSHVSYRIENATKTAVIVRYLAEEAEVAQGLWAAPGADLTYDNEGHLARVSKTSRVYRVPGTEILAAAGQPIEFFTQNGRPRVIEQIEKAFEILPGVWVRAGERVEWLHDGEYARIGWDFYNPALNVPGSTGSSSRSLAAPQTVPSYIGVAPSNQQKFSAE